MKKLLFALAAFLMGGSAMAQALYYQDARNVDMKRHTNQHDVLRQEFVLPMVNGYQVLKSDLHTHSIYSDGDVTPEFRVREAWYDGLDVVAITEHIEYRPHEGKMFAYLKGYLPEEATLDTERGIKADLNLANRRAEAEATNYGVTVIPGIEITREPETIGHYNALFVQDANTIHDPDPAVAIKNARAQGAIIMHNHPGWRRKNLKLSNFEKKVYSERLIDGVEIMNGDEFYPTVVKRALEEGLFMAANTDIHGSTTMDYVAQGHRRNMTFILAKENSPEAIREALLSHRTLAYSFGTLAGEEPLVKEFFQACVRVEIFHVNKEGRRALRLVNNTSMDWVIQFGKANPVRLRPFTSHIVRVAKQHGLACKVLNAWVPTKGDHPTIQLLPPPAAE